MASGQVRHTDDNKDVQLGHLFFLDCLLHVRRGSFRHLCNILKLSLQVTEIKNRFLGSDVTALHNISVATIDSFQGQENDIILISLVRRSKSGIIGHLSSPNRLCVAISRARCGLYLFGNDAQLSKASKDWKKVIDAMREKGCLGDKRFPFRSSSQFKSQGKAEDQMEGRSPGKEPQTMFVENLTMINATNVVLAGDNSKNTIATTPATLASRTRLPPDLEIPQVRQSEKQPVHDPKSPTLSEGSPPPRIEGGSGSADRNPDFVPVQVEGREGHGADVEHVVVCTKEARMPIQESPEVKKSSPDSSETEKEDQRPVQESENPKNSITDTTITDEEIMAGGKETRQPTQATSKAETLSVDVSELENMKERPVQESENPKNSISETTVMDEEIMAGDKEARQPTQATSEAEKSCADVSELENMKEKPVQESENPKSSTADTPTMEEELMKKAPAQESEEPTERKDELKDHPETRVRQVFQEGDLKDSASSDVQTKSSNEEALPTQETMPAGKGPFEETGLEVGVKGLPTDEQE